VPNPFTDIPHDSGRKLQFCICFFQHSVPGYYNNMFLVETVKKSKAPTPPATMPPRRIWLRVGRVDWAAGPLPRHILVALAFHRRDRFSDGIHDPPDYYLSVGMNDGQVTLDETSGDQSDTYGPTDIVTAIVAECHDFNLSLPVAHQRRLYIARHEELILTQTRLKNIFEDADSRGFLEPETGVAATLASNGRQIWPALMVPKLRNYW
jgi:hypothetical protein